MSLISHSISLLYFSSLCACKMISISNIIIILWCGLQGVIAVYSGEWDISALETATLCASAARSNSFTNNGHVNVTKLSGPEGQDVVAVWNHDPIPTPKRSSYLPGGSADKCWKNEWVPCTKGDGLTTSKEEEEVKGRIGSDGVLSRRMRPCGHYRMVKVSRDHCA